MADEQTNMTDEQMQSIHSQFARMDDRFARVDERFAKMDERFARMDRHFGDLKADVSAQRTTLDHVDAEVHRQGILREQEHGELKLAIEAFQTAQKVTNAKIDLVQDGIDNRLVPLELAVRSHSSTLADHGRRLDRDDERS